MIRCFLTLCLVASPHVCQPETEIVPIDHVMTSPMECLRGGVGPAFAQARIDQATPAEATPAPLWFAKVRSELDGDGSDIVRTWLEDQRARAARLAPQIK